jgi:hypothetical protein
VTVPEDDEDELLKKFEAAISGMEVGDLHQLAQNLTMFAGRLPAAVERR